jgi:type IV pilus assembly protein PilQ
VKKFISLVLMMCLCFEFVGAAELVGGAVDNASDRKKISLDFPETSLSTVLGVLSIKTGYKFITDGELAKKKIILSLKDVTPDEALNALMDTYNLYYVRQQNTDIYVVKSKSDGAIAMISKVIFLNYPSAKDMETVLGKNLTRGGSLSADERTNSLIVTDTAESVEKMEIMLRALDVPTMQILLEAKIVEVQMDSTLNVGTDFGDIYRTNYWLDPTQLERWNTFSDFEFLDTDVQPQVAYGQGFAPGIVGSGKLKLSVLSGDYNIQGVIEAVKKDGKGRILNNPRLLVLNGKEAYINIVEQLPYEERTIATAGTVTITTSYKEVGIKLKVKPQINREGTIIMSVEPEQSFNTGRTLNNVPIINTSKSNTTFILENGETAVIGGLIRESDTTSESKLPLLGDIPILGYLFKRQDKEKVRRELTIFITAKIVQ